MKRRNSLKIAAVGILSATGLGTGCAAAGRTPTDASAAPRTRPQNTTTPAPSASNASTAASTTGPSESTPPSSPSAASSTAPSTAAPRVKGLDNRPPQSAAICYDNHFENLSSYARPGGLVVAGRTNYAHRAFKNISAAGGTVLIYLDCIIEGKYGRYHDLLFNASEFGPPVPRWPGLPKANQWGYLTDFRVGGVLQTKLAGVLEKMVAENPHMGGWFADDLGTKSHYPGAPWNEMTATAQQQYRDGAIAVAKTFRRVADKYGLLFLVNGSWSGNADGGYPDPRKHGCALADGGVIEHHPADAYHLNYATSTQWAARSAVTNGTSFQYVIARTDAERDAWRRSGACAFVSAQSHYGRAPAPYSQLRPTGLPNRVTR
ncbi:hypothetical protein [Streptomyces wuyuanensis]|uniref:hypothetical protein n=1 Tax=Streptomyces wuyuanensis TaxID=1196353 RepID=UPI003718C9B8